MADKLHETDAARDPRWPRDEWGNPRPKLQQPGETLSALTWPEPKHVDATTGQMQPPQTAPEPPPLPALPTRTAAQRFRSGFMTKFARWPTIEEMHQAGIYE